MSLKKQTYSGLIWSFSDAIFVRGLLFVAMILLARWIGPNDFGLVGMIAIFIAIGKTLTDSGMTASLIRTKEPDQTDYSTVFFTNITMSLIVYIFIYFAAPFIADFFGQIILIKMIRVYCFIFLVISFSAVQMAFLTKEMNFSKITKIHFPSTIIGVSIGLYLGYHGHGVWSIIFMYLSTEFVKTILLWTFSNWSPELIFSKRKFKLHYKFGYKLVLSALLDTVFKNIHNVIIGKFFSLQTLGFYERSKEFSEYPSSMLTGVIGKVTYPMLSKLQDDPVRLESIYRKLIRVSFFIIAALMLGFAGIAKPLFLMVLGNQWLPAVLFFQILCLAMMLYPIHAFNLDILKVYGRSDLFLKLEIIKKCITTVSIIVAFQYGVLGLVWSSVFTSYAALGINMYYSSRLINYSIKEQIKDLSLTLILAIITSILIYQTVNYFNDKTFFTQLLISSLVGFIFYIGINYFIKNSPMHELVRLIKTKKI